MDERWGGRGERGDDIWIIGPEDTLGIDLAPASRLGPELRAFQTQLERECAYAELSRTQHLPHMVPYLSRLLKQRCRAYIFPN